MGRLSQNSVIEKILGRWRIIDLLLEQKEPIQQASLAKKVNASGMTVNRIMKSLTEDQRLQEVFKVEKKYGAKIYWIQKNHPLAIRLNELREDLKKIESIK